jgi:hypothetical protein
MADWARVITGASLVLRAAARLAAPQVPEPAIESIVRALQAGGASLAAAGSPPAWPRSARAADWTPAAPTSSPEFAEQVAFADANPPVQAKGRERSEPVGAAAPERAETLTNAGFSPSSGVGQPLPPSNSPSDTPGAGRP